MVMNSPRPTFLTSKKERKEGRNFYLLDRYLDIWKGLFKWEGLPEEVPEGFIEECLFTVGGVGCKRVPSLSDDPLFLPAAASLFDWYGNPIEWVPSFGWYTVSQGLNVPIMEESNTPALVMGEPMQLKIEPYTQLMESALKVLDQNIIALAQPVIVEGVPGGELGTVTMLDNVLNVNRAIAAVQGSAIPIKVHNLEAQDHTQNLISTIRALDSEILAIMGVSNPGAEKASGITTVETTSQQEELNLRLDWELGRRKQFCDKVNKEYGLSISVRYGDGVIDGKNAGTDGDINNGIGAANKADAGRQPGTEAQS